MKDLTFITGNQNKADFLAKNLGISLLHHKLDLDEIQSVDLQTVVEHKVRQAYLALQKPVLVEDAGLFLSAMGGKLPGPFIKWFVAEMGVDGFAALVQQLSDQSAIARVVYGLYDGNEVHYFEGEARGSIAPEPRGKNGFGYDPIFVNDGYAKTRAEMTEAEYAATSHRTPALRKLRAFLQTHA